MAATLDSANLSETRIWNGSSANTMGMVFRAAYRITGNAE